MAYSSEIVERARQHLAEARADRESENRAHLEQAYARVPRIREIDIALRHSMAAAAQLIFEQGLDAREHMEQVKRQNLSLQQERARLADEYFEEGFLDDSPICDKCGGTGYMGNTMCECLSELCRQEQRKTLRKSLGAIAGGPESFSQFRLSYYPDAVDRRFGASPRAIMERNFQKCQNYAGNFSMNSGNLLFVGATGLGKTYLSVCIAKAVAEKGYRVAYESAPHLFNKLEKARFSQNEEAKAEVERILGSDLLVLDDLGTEMMSQFVTASMYSLINDRILERKPTVISTNFTFEDLSRRYSEQVASRLYGDYTVLMFAGEDIRRKKMEMPNENRNYF